MAQPVANQGAAAAAAAPVTPAPVAAPEPVAPVQPVAPVAQPAPAQAPAETNRAREEFEKLLENNRKLHQANQLLTEEVLRRTQLSQQFAPLQGQPAQPNMQDFVEIDPETGTKYINEQKLQAQLATANQRATRAEQVVQNYIKASENREIERQNTEAFAVYPELNPNSSGFNSAFSNQTSAVILHSMINPRSYGGRPLTFVEAAKLVKQGVTAPMATPPQPANGQQVPAANGQSTQDLRADASVDLRSQPPAVLPSAQADAKLAGLQARTRLGDDSALAERLKFTEHIVPKEGTS